jgi:hypothetical protein
LSGFSIDFFDEEAPGVFPTPVENATHIALMFQGGFVGTTAVVYVATRRGHESRIDEGKVCAVQGVSLSGFSIDFFDEEAPGEVRLRVSQLAEEGRVGRA